MPAFLPCFCVANAFCDPLLFSCFVFDIMLTAGRSHRSRYWFVWTLPPYPPHPSARSLPHAPSCGRAGTSQQPRRYQSVLGRQLTPQEPENHRLQILHCPLEDKHTSQHQIQGAVQCAHTDKQSFVECRCWEKRFKIHQNSLKVIYIDFGFFELDCWVPIGNTVLSWLHFTAVFRSCCLYEVLTLPPSGKVLKLLWNGNKISANVKALFGVKLVNSI